LSMAAYQRHLIGIGVSDTNAPNQEKAHLAFPLQVLLKYAQV